MRETENASNKTARSFFFSLLFAKSGYSLSRVSEGTQSTSWFLSLSLAAASILESPLSAVPPHRHLIIQDPSAQRWLPHRRLGWHLHKDSGQSWQTVFMHLLVHRSPGKADNALLEWWSLASTATNPRFPAQGLGEQRCSVTMGEWKVAWARQVLTPPTSVHFPSLGTLETRVSHEALNYPWVSDVPGENWGGCALFCYLWPCKVYFFK